MKNIFTILIICTFISCKENPKTETIEKQSFTLTGTINDDYSGYIYLNYGNVKDSVKALNNSFEFKGTVKAPIQGRLTLEGLSAVAGLYIENSDIIITTDLKTLNNEGQTFKFLKIKEITGSKTAIIQDDWNEFFQSNNNKENFNELLYNKLKELIKNNPNHSFNVNRLVEIPVVVPNFKYEYYNELFQMIDTTDQDADEIEMIKMGLSGLKYSKGKNIFDFQLPDINNQLLSTKDYRGNTLLIDFWASWCVPCRKQHPELIELYNENKQNGFEILSVSIDEDKTNWNNAIKTDKLTWPNVLDSKYEIGKVYGIVAVPFNYLIDTKGKIIGVNLSLEEIKEILKTEKASR
jgi:peroxiredoxin